MKKSKHQIKFRFGLFKKSYFFETDLFGLVFEKSPRAVCIYVTDKKHSVIFAAIPMGYDKNLHRFEFCVSFKEETKIFTVKVGVFKILIDPVNCKVASNKNAKVFGSEIWGYDCSVPWSSDFEKQFNEVNNETNLCTSC